MGPPCVPVGCGGPSGHHSEARKEEDQKRRSVVRCLSPLSGLDDFKVFSVVFQTRTIFHPTHPETFVNQANLAASILAAQWEGGARW